MGILIPFASGKGGVGKSLLVANLGIALAQTGKTVVLVDLDLGAANLHTMLGIRNSYAGIGNMIHKEVKNLEGLVVQTPVPRLHFIPGDALLPGTANLDWFTKQKIIRALYALPADFILLDLGAGSAWNTVDFFLCSSRGAIVVCPEITSILNAYAFLKSAWFRSLLRAFPPKSEVRLTIKEFMARRLEGAKESADTLLATLRQRWPERVNPILDQLPPLYPAVIVNMATSEQDAQMALRLRSICSKNLGLSLEYLSFIPRDDIAGLSIARREPAILSYPGSAFSQALSRTAQKLAAIQASPIPQLYPGDEDLASAARDFGTQL